MLGKEQPPSTLSISYVLRIADISFCSVFPIVSTCCFIRQSISVQIFMTSVLFFFSFFSPLLDSIVCVIVRLCENQIYIGAAAQPVV